MSDLMVIRSSAALPSTSTETLFSVEGGVVLVTGIVGIVTESVDASQNSEVKFGSISVWAGQLSGYTDTYLIGTPSGNGSGKPFAQGQVVRSGVDVTLTTDSTTSGAVEWWLTYRPLTPGAFVEVNP